MSAKIEPVLTFDLGAVQAAFAVNGGVLVVAAPGSAAEQARRVDPSLVTLDVMQGDTSLPWRAWKPANGIGDWDALATGLDGAEIVVYAPRPVVARPEVRRLLKDLAAFWTDLGATAALLYDTPASAEAAADAVHARAWLDALRGTEHRAVDLQAEVDPRANAKQKPSRPVVAKVGDDNAFIDTEATDRPALLDAVVEAVVAANDADTSLFLTGPSLVTVYGGELLAVETKPQLADWCKTNDVPLGTWKRTAAAPSDSAGAPPDETPWERRFLPDDVANVLTASPLSWTGRLPEIASLSVLPFMRPDGSFVDRAGYDPVTRVYITDDAAGRAVARVPQDVSQASAKTAAAWLLREVFVDFPFVTQADRANAVGALLTALTRYVHQRPSPLFGIVAPDAGTGKGLLTDVLATILQGKPAEPSVLSDSEDEQRKAITTVLRSSSDPVVSWDNLQSNSKVSSRILCQLHTSATWKDRLLGGNTELRLENDRLWIATGNNIGPGEDMVRRWVQIGLDAGMPHPEERTKFRHNDLRAWILEHREDALTMLLVMLRGWDQAGRPKPLAEMPVLGDYRPIVKRVGGVLEFCGIPGFLANTQAVRDDAAAGSEDEATEEFLTWMTDALDAYPDPNVTALTFDSATVVDVLAKVGGADGFVGVATSEAPIPPAIAAKLGKGTVAVRNAVSAFLNGAKDRRFGEAGVRVVKSGEKVNRRTAFALTTDRGPGAEPLTHPQVTAWRERQGAHDYGV